jgi:hypothetical protein
VYELSPIEDYNMYKDYSPLYTTVSLVQCLDFKSMKNIIIIIIKMIIAVKVQISKPLCMLFNKYLLQNIFPTDWKLAHVIPFDK